MRVKFERGFVRDLDRIRSKSLRLRVDRAVNELRSADSIEEIPGVVRLQGTANLFRIRIGDYRIGLERSSAGVTLIRFRHRSNFYRGFPR